MNKQKSWHRLTLSLFGIIVIVLCWRWAVAHLYTIPEYSVAAFTSVTTNAFYVVGAIVIFMVTGRLVYDWSNKTQAASEILSKVIRVKEDITEASTEKIEVTNEGRI